MENLMTRMTDGLPAAVTEALRIAGANVRAVRRSRKITMRQLAARMFVTPATLRKVERGDPTVTAGNFAAAFWALDLAAAKVFPGGAGLWPPPVGGWSNYDPLPPHLADDNF